MLRGLVRPPAEDPRRRSWRGGTLRQEKGSLGVREIPDEAYWGAQTSRAVENYPISGERAHAERALPYARIKRACAETNREQNRLPEDKTRAIVAACDEVLAGKHHDQ